jgi:hypothetical protein
MDDMALVQECRQAFLSIQQRRGHWFGDHYRPRKPRHWECDCRIWKAPDGDIVTQIRRESLHLPGLRLLGEDEVDFLRIAAVVKLLRDANNEPALRAPRKIVADPTNCGVVKTLYPFVDCGLETALAACVARITSWVSLAHNALRFSNAGNHEWKRIKNIGFTLSPPNPEEIPPRFTLTGNRRYFCAGCEEFSSARSFHLHYECHTRMLR